jgi:hypothetical protein
MARRHKRSELNILCIYKNFGAMQGISHIGLGVSATNNVKNLHHMGIRAQVIAVKDDEGLKQVLIDNKDVTHVIVSAPWIMTATFSQLCAQYPDTQFAMVSHSNVGFLQADIRGIQLIKEALDLEGSAHNFHLAGNCKEFQGWVENTFKAPCTFLPNMYYLHHRHGERKELWDGGKLRLGVFGAARIQKNFVTAVAAAMEIAAHFGVQTEIWMNSGRDDGPESKRLRVAISQLCSEMPNVELKFASWSSWGTFKRLVGSMNLLLQPSYTESFNMVTADGVSQGVPSVVSDVVTWAPDYWKARIDDANDIARRGVGILRDPGASRIGLLKLKHYVRDGREAWLSYLTCNRFGNHIE